MAGWTEVCLLLFFNVLFTLFSANEILKWSLLTLMQQLLSVGGLFALRLKESVDALLDQILPARPARCSQSTCFYGDDLPWSRTPHAHEHTLMHAAYRCRHHINICCSFHARLQWATFISKGLLTKREAMCLSIHAHHNQTFHHTS